MASIRGSIRKEPQERGARINTCASSSLGTLGSNQRRSLEPTTPWAILTPNEGRFPIPFGNPGSLLTPQRYPNTATTAPSPSCPPVFSFHKPPTPLHFPPLRRSMSIDPP